MSLIYLPIQQDAKKEATVSSVSMNFYTEDYTKVDADRVVTVDQKGK